WLDARVLEQVGAAQCDDPQLTEAVKAYAGELLPGFYDEWVLPERQRLNALFEQCSQQLLDCLIDQQRWPEVTKWSEVVIAHSPTTEGAYRALMMACAEQRDMAGVAAAYERCRAILQTD